MCVNSILFFLCLGLYPSTSDFRGTLPLFILVPLTNTGTSPTWTRGKIMHMHACNSKVPVVSQTSCHRFTRSKQCGAAVWLPVGSRGLLLHHPISLGVLQAVCRERCQLCHECMSPGRFHLQDWRSLESLDSESWFAVQSFQMNFFKYLSSIMTRYLLFLVLHVTCTVTCLCSLNVYSKFIIYFV